MSERAEFIEGAATPLVWVANSSVEGWLHQDVDTGSVYVGAQQIGNTLTPHEILILECAMIGHASVEGVVSIGDIRDSFNNAPGHPVAATVAATVVDRISARFQEYLSLDIVKIENATGRNSLNKKGITLTPVNRTIKNDKEAATVKAVARKLTEADVKRIAPRTDRTSIGSRRS